MAYSLDTLSAQAVTSLRHSEVILGQKVCLRRGRIHEVTGTGADVFALFAAASHGADIVWIGLRRDIETLSPLGLRTYLDPSRVLLVEGVSRGELLWAAEQALRAEGSFAVMLDMPNALSLKESRRLQLATEEGGGLGIVRLRSGAANSAAQTRWHCVSVKGRPSNWVWHCTKGKNGEAGRWRVQYVGEEGGEDTLHVVSATAA